MEQSQALHKLLESADLIKLVEEITSLGASEKLSAAALAGMRITLRSVRENILASHDRLSGNFIQNSRAAIDPRSQMNMEGATTSAPSTTSVMTTTPPLASFINKESVSIPAESEAKVDPVSAARTALLSDPEKLQMMRKDLRASLQKMVEGK